MRAPAQSARAAALERSRRGAHPGSGQRRIAESVGGDDLRWISGYISVKEAHSRALWWYQDWWCWDHPLSLCPVATQVALLRYLTDTSERDGALRVLPGSHRCSVALYAALPAAHAQGASLGHDHAALTDHRDQVTLSANAGDAVVLDYRPLHGTHANASGERRDCVLLSFTPSWRELPKDVRAHLIQHLAQPDPDERPALSGWQVRAVRLCRGGGGPLRDRRADLGRDPRRARRLPPVQPLSVCRALRRAGHHRAPSDRRCAPGHLSRQGPPGLLSDTLGGDGGGGQRHGAW